MCVCVSVLLEGSNFVLSSGDQEAWRRRGRSITTLSWERRPQMVSRECGRPCLHIPKLLRKKVKKFVAKSHLSLQDHLHSILVERKK